MNYVLEKMVLEKPLDGASTEVSFAPGGQSQHLTVGDGPFRSGLKSWQKLRPSIEILCNNQASDPEYRLELPVQLIGVVE